MHRQRGSPGNRVAWARKKLCPWRTARKHLVRYYRDGRSPSWICREAGVSRQWLWKWIHRWEAEGRRWSALDDRPSRPRTIHTKRHLHSDEILRLKSKYPGLGALKLKLIGNLQLSHTTIHRVLTEHRKTKQKKQTWAKVRRFERPYANYLWQLDTCQIRTKNDGWVYVQTLIDDHSRFVLASHATNAFPTRAESLRLVLKACQMWGRPRQVLTDNGNEFCPTSGDEPGLLTLSLAELGIRHIRGRPNHPRTQGKIERWHRSLKYEWLAHCEPALDRATVQRYLLHWLEHYNLVRPHSALKNRTPSEVFLASLITIATVDQAVNEAP